MTTTQRTEHNPDALRWILTGPAGELEFRITPTWAVVIHPEADGERDCEAIQGDEVKLLWMASGQEDAVIWAELERRYQPYLHAEPRPSFDPFAAIEAATGRNSTAYRLEVGEMPIHDRPSSTSPARITRRAITEQIREACTQRGIPCEITMSDALGGGSRLLVHAEGQWLTPGEAADKYLLGEFAANYGRI